MKLFISFFVSIICSSIVSFAQPGIRWSKDGNSYYAIENKSVVKYQLPSFDKSVVIDPSQLKLGENKGSLSVRDFFLSEDGNKALIYTNTRRVWRQDTKGDYWLLDVTNNRLRQLGKGKPASSLMFAKISPDGTKAAYVSEHNIYVEDLATNKITALTKNGTARVINGTFDWAYEEEFDCRDGFRWSPDSKKIAYWQIDATKIRNFLLINNTESIYSFTVPVEYPKVGEDPAACRVGVVTVATAQTKWMNVPGDQRQHYIPRMEWTMNSNEIILEQLNRKQNEAKVYVCNTTSGLARNIYSEKDAAWIDVKGRWSDDPTGWEWLSGGKTFLWVSEKDGWRHIYKVDLNGKETLLTKGNYDIISVKAIDQAKDYVYFMASPDNATQQYLYRVAMNGHCELELLSPANQKGTHNYTVSPNALYAAHSFSNYKNERVSEWVNLASNESIKSNTQGSASRGNTGANNVEMFKITTADNITMDGWMVKPRNFDSTKKYPVLFTVYAEPASTTVRDVAGIGRSGQYNGDLAADGYIYISVEGRGTPLPKGAAWRKAIYRNIGIVNIRDQAMAAKEIMKWQFVDTSRIAVTGWSGGGSTTLNLLFQYPEIYKTGIAIAPVANQLLYDNIYQERFMGLPQENLQDFIKGSPVTHAKNLRGNLLVIHGTGDDNVHYQGTEMLINELVRHGKQFQMMSYPNRTHGISEGEGTSLHLANLFTAYLKEHCPGGGR
ncbi:MAG: DPP IV N-terminal domain-containing protein [Chitinophagaceae bacterium]